VSTPTDADLELARQWLAENVVDYFPSVDDPVASLATLIGVQQRMETRRQRLPQEHPRAGTGREVNPHRKGMDALG
jgi:hypothetical protein